MKNRLLLLIYILLGLACAGIIFGVSFLSGNYVKASEQNKLTFSRKEQLVPSHTALILSAYSKLSPNVEDKTNGVEQIFRDNNIIFDILYMDSISSSDSEAFRLYNEYFEHRLSVSNIDYEIFVALDEEALYFLEYYLQKNRIDKPVVFVDRSVMGSKLEDINVTGVYQNSFIADTLSIALRQNPSTKFIYAIHDESIKGLGLLQDYYNSVSIFSDVVFGDINLELQSAKELEETFARIPEHSICVFLAATEYTQNIFSTIPQMIDFICNHTDNIPVYTISNTGLGQGFIGGKLFDYTQAGRDAAQLAVDLLNGKSMEECTPVSSSTGKYYFDREVLKKFGIKNSTIPVNSVIINQKYSYWKEYSSILIPFCFILFSLAIILAIGVTAYIHMLKNSEELENANIKMSYANRQLELSRDKMKYLSTHDFMTQLPIRACAKDEIASLLYKESCFSVMLLDIDDFKNINDTYSHTCGDFVLEEFAHRLAVISKDTNYFAARYGGDEFILIYRGGILNEDGEEIKKIRKILNEPFYFGDMKMDVKSSCGVADTRYGNSEEELVINADLALYESKRKGKNMTSFFSKEMKTAAEKKNLIMKVVEEACHDKSFEVVYQPQVDVKSGKLHGLEALVRLPDNSIPPAEFVPVAEENGCIIQLGRIVTEKVILQMRRWKEEGLELHKVAINYSNGQLADSKYVSYLETLLNDNGIPHELVEIEITESLFLGNTKLANQLFSSLEGIGVSTALDDFGTGYSSLSYLTYVPVKKVKIDKSMVDNYLQDGKEDFIKNIVTLVHGLGMTLTVEGVEKKEQYEKLSRLQCDYIQGYYYSRPISYVQLKEWVSSSPEVFKVE